MYTNGEVNAKVVEQGEIPIQAIHNKPPPAADDVFPKWIVCHAQVGRQE